MISWGAASRRLLLGTVLSLLLLLGGCGGGEGPSTPTQPGASATKKGKQGGPPSAKRERKGGARRSNEDAIAVKSERVERGAMSQLYSTSTTLRAERTATITARTRGRIQQLLVEEGDRVKAGQPVARLEDDEQRIDYERAETTYETNEREAERVKRLFEQELVSDNEYETARREADDARHALERAELELSRTTVRAPFSGRILKRYIDVGATVQDGTEVYDVADLDPLYADVPVPERQVGALSPGQVVRVHSDASGEVVEGVIERIAPAVDADTGTVKVTVAVPPRAGLRPGGFARVEIVTARNDDALIIARQALVAEGRRFQVFRVQRDEEGPYAELLHVVPGFEEADRVEISEVLDDSDPLQEGDEVVVIGAPALSEGSRLRLVDESEDVAEVARTGQAS